MIKIKHVTSPLKASFLITALIGFIVSVYFVPLVSAKWATAFAIFFFLMVVASLISMAKAPLEEK